MIFDQLQAESRTLPPVPTPAAALAFAGQALHASPVLLVRRPLTVEAMRVEANNLYLVATWCGGNVLPDRGVWVGSRSMGAPAYIGDWVIRSPWGEWYPATDEGITAGYDQVRPVVSE